MVDDVAWTKKQRHVSHTCTYACVWTRLCACAHVCARVYVIKEKVMRSEVDNFLKF